MAQVLSNTTPNTSPHVAIIGAGCAGLAAASLLARSGTSVTLFEASPQLGGRARGIAYQGLTLDNGQHMLLGAYQETIALLQLAGVDLSQAMHRLPLSMCMVSPHSQLKLNTCTLLPAPLHLLAGLLMAKGLSTHDKYLAIRFMGLQQLRQFKLTTDLPLAQFLQQQRQSPFLVAHLWEPLCLAALNTPLAQASSQVFLNVLRDSFTGKKTDSDFLLAKHDLSSLIATPLSQYLTAHGANITHATVQHISPCEAGFTLQSQANTQTFSHVIIAVGPHQLSHILPSALASSVDMPQLSYQPITTVYLQYTTTQTLPQAMLGMVGTLSQWAFDRGQLCGQHGLIAVVISACGAHQNMSHAELAHHISAELQNLNPNLGDPIWHKVITEKRATFSCNAGLQRPSNHTEIANLYLAGDYTAGDYPATIEGAVRSGLQAAKLVINNMQSLQPT